MKKFKIFFLSSFILLSFCSDKNEEILSPKYEFPESNEAFSNFLKITTEKSEYKYDEVKYESVIIIQANLQNNSDDTLYTKLGDNINESLDQENLMIAFSSDGDCEKYEKEIWNKLKLALKYEGNKIVRILPYKHYSLAAVLYDSVNIEGVFRLKVNFSKSILIDQSEKFSDVSNMFIISD